VRIVFHHDPRGECVARIYRNDSVTMELPSYSRKWTVPHDLAHAVAERELGLAGGVFGCIASGAIFSNMRLLQGRLRYDAAERSARILKAHRGSIGVAELLAGVLHDTVEHGRAGTPFDWARRNWGVLSPEQFPWTVDDVERATDVLRDQARQWQGADTLEFFWPDRLTVPVPPAPRPARRRPRSRR